jgi:protein-disulfide isomerase|tara:strand:+ start:1334 stop:2059 length:726 start_codon:yes stop_codon:yes gene_type:complete
MSDTVTIKKSTAWKLATFVFAVLFVISIFTGGFGYGDDSVTGGAVAPIPNPSAPAPSAPAQVTVEVENDDHILGEENADISIIEFSDFQCPFCERAFSGAVTDLKNSDYFKDGDVNFVFKQFPLNSIHPQAQKAAEASECAGDQGKFWEYHDTLFQNQNSLGISNLKQYAKDLGLDSSEFDSCLDDGDKASVVSDDLDQAKAAGGRGTPYFVVYNKKTGDTAPVSGAVPFAQLEAAIQAVL